MRHARTTYRGTIYHATRDGAFVYISRWLHDESVMHVGTWDNARNRIQRTQALRNFLPKRAVSRLQKQLRAGVMYMPPRVLIVGTDVTRHGPVSFPGGTITIASSASAAQLLSRRLGPPLFDEPTVSPREFAERAQGILAGNVTDEAATAIFDEVEQILSAPRDVTYRLPGSIRPVELTIPIRFSTPQHVDATITYTGNMFEAQEADPDLQRAERAYQDWLRGCGLVEESQTYVDAVDQFRDAVLGIPPAWSASGSGIMADIERAVRDSMAPAMRAFGVSMDEAAEAMRMLLGDDIAAVNRSSVTQGSPQYMQSLVDQVSDETAERWCRAWRCDTRADLRDRVLEVGAGDAVPHDEARELAQLILADVGQEHVAGARRGDRSRYDRHRSPDTPDDLDHVEVQQEPLEDSEWFKQLLEDTECRSSAKGSDPNGE